MGVITDAIIGGIVWEAFSKTLSFYTDSANDFVLRLYIANELKSLPELNDTSPKKIEETAEVIETTILKTPDNIKQIENKDEQKKAFEKYFKNNSTIRNITTKNYFEKIVVKDGGTINFD